MESLLPAPGVKKRQNKGLRLLDFPQKRAVFANEHIAVLKGRREIEPQRLKSPPHEIKLLFRPPLIVERHDGAVRAHLRLDDVHFADPVFFDFDDGELSARRFSVYIIQTILRRAVEPEIIVPLCLISRFGKGAIPVGGIRFLAVKAFQRLVLERHIGFQKGMKAIRQGIRDMTL